MGNQAIKECPSGSVYLLNKITKTPKCVTKEAIYKSDQFSIESKNQVRNSNFTVYVQDVENLIPLGWDLEYKFYKGPENSNWLNLFGNSEKEISNLAKKVPTETIILGEGTYGKVSKIGVQELVTKVTIFESYDFINELSSMTLLNHLYKQLSFSPEDCCIIPFYSIQYNDDKVKLLVKAFPGTLRDLQKKIQKTREIKDIEEKSFQERIKDPEIIRKCFYTILKSMFFISNVATILHLDLKPQNILANEDGNCYVGDYGLSTWGSLINLSFERNFNVQTLWYRAPEVFLEKRYGRAADAWSVGIILRDFFYPESIIGYNDVNQFAILTGLFPPEVISQDEMENFLDITKPIEDGIEFKVKAREKYIELKQLWNSGRLRKTPLTYQSQIPQQYKTIINELLTSDAEIRNTDYSKYLNLNIFKDYRAAENLSPLIFQGDKFSSINGEDFFKLLPTFGTSSPFEKRQDNLSRRAREILVNWLIDLSIHGKLAPVVPLVASYFLDEYLRINKSVGTPVFQALGCACFFISAYLISPTFPSVDELSYLSENSASVDQIHVMIRKVLESLENNLYRLNPLIIYPEANTRAVYANIYIGSEMNPFEIAEWYEAQHTDDFKTLNMVKFVRLNAALKIADKKILGCSVKDMETFLVISEEEKIFCLTKEEFWESEKRGGDTKLPGIPLLTPETYDSVRKYGENTFLIKGGQIHAISREYVINE